MRCVPFLVAMSVAMSAAVLSEGVAQSSAIDTAPVTGMKPDRTSAPRAVREAMQKREAAIRRKRAACRAEAKAEKVPLLRRPAYVKMCGPLKLVTIVDRKGDGTTT
jgi:hypothetical protein